MSHISLTYHIVWRTKRSERTICEEHERDLYAYILGICSEKKCHLYRLNSMPDHFHMCVEVHPTLSVSEFMQVLKQETSRWISAHKEWFPMFDGWGNGYAAFTYSVKERPTVIEYIKNQNVLCPISPDTYEVLASSQLSYDVSQSVTKCGFQPPMVTATQILASSQNSNKRKQKTRTMNKTFKSLLALALIAVAMSFASCSKDDVKSSEEPVVRLAKFHDYLYGMEYDDYDFETAKNSLDVTSNLPKLGCSQVRKGNFVGRNLDYYINSDLNAIIRVNHKGEPEKATVSDLTAFYNSRYASIGVTGCSPNFTTEKVSNTTDLFPVYEILPICTMDGINENGVYVAINMDATGETSEDTSRWNFGYFGLGAAFTNPSSSLKMSTYGLVRVVLDHAKSVDDAISIIESINWYDPILSSDGLSQSFHWLLADATTNCVLEFIDNKPVFLKTTDINSPSLATIMTNFTNYLWQKGIIQNYGTGYERYDILAARYPDTPCSFEGMQGLMEYVWSSKCYTLDIDDPDFLATDQADEYFTSAQLYKNPDVLNDPLFQSIYRYYQEGYYDYSTWYTPECEVWLTTHTSIYDLSTRTLKVKVNEGFDGMNDYMTFNMNSHFPKPLNNKQ